MTELETMQRAKMYLDKLAQGINPITDEEVPEDSVLNNVRLARCFFYVSGVLDQLIANGQVATQYVDLEGEPTMDQRYNPNGSLLAIEGITSPDGRVFGKMGHSERSGEYLYKNVTGDKYQPIFEGGVDYFKV